MPAIFCFSRTKDRLDGPAKHDRDVDLAVGRPAAGIDDGAEQQQLRAVEAVADLHLARGNVGNEHRLVGRDQQRREQREEDRGEARASQIFDREDLVRVPEQAEEHAQADEQDDHRRAQAAA